MRVKRAEKYGFCAGVRIADQKVKRFAQLGGTGGQILGQVVHNERVVEEMEELGVPTVQSLDETANGTIVFCLPGSSGACRDGWDKLIVHQLDARTRPCNLVEMMPRFLER